MKPLVLKAHFDGKQILLDDPYPLAPNAKLMVTVIPPDAEAHDGDRWKELSLSGLASAYGEAEPEYSLSMVKETNPDYEGG